MKYAVKVFAVAAVGLIAAAIPLSAAEQAKTARTAELFKTDQAADKAGSITIEQAIDTALQQNSSVLIAQKTAQIYDQQVKEYWSYVYPSVELSGSYTRALRPQSTITSMGNFRFSLDNATSGLAQASLLLWKGGAVNAGIKIGQYYSQGGYLDLKEAQNNISNLD